MESRTEKSSKDEEPGKKGPYPRSVFFIISNEFCERFSYYGMKTILTIYLTSILLFSDEDSKSIYHGFTMIAYFTPLIGAIIADSWLGKFKTIFYVSIIYALGNVVLAFGAFNLGQSSQRLFSLLGLALIALGTGGIKPCVAAFGGDQFVKGQEVYLQQFFTVFYISINSGSAISTALTPILRTVHCQNQDTCFSLAFGVPAALMITALALFLVGKPFYRMNPPGNNVIVRLGGCIGQAIKNKFTSGNERREHWLDYADDKYDQKFIEEVKAVCRVLIIYIPVPFFWALFDQQGSTWTLQATRMRWSVFGVKLLPDQVQLLNPFFILILAPLFGYVIYPLCEKCGVLKKPLQKMIVGGLLASASFLVCMFLQLAVEGQDSNAMSLVNTAPCDLSLSYNNATISANGGQLQIKRPFPESILITPACKELKRFTYYPSSSHKASREKLIAANNSEISIIDMPELGKNDLVDVKVIFIGDVNRPNIKLLEETKNLNLSFTIINKTLEVGVESFRASFEPNAEKSYILTVGDTDPITCEKKQMGAGEAYTYVIQTQESKCRTYRTVETPSLSLIWQAPQYIIMTAGEVMFSVTGVEFSYSQAPVSMKAVLQAGWLMTVALGNFLVVVVAAIGIEKQSTEFLVFSVVMLVDMIVFSVMAYFYVPVTPPSDDDTDVEHKEMSDLEDSATAKL